MAVHQLDVLTAYLNGSLNEKVYMEKPEMLEEILQKIVLREGKDSKNGVKASKMLTSSRGRDAFCLLRMALYGLRQTGLQWHARLDGVIRKLGRIPTNADPCLYYARRDRTLLLALVYVGDVLLSSQDVSWIEEFSRLLAREFEIKKFGMARYCLGIEIIQDRNSILLNFTWRHQMP